MKRNITTLVTIVFLSTVSFAATIKGVDTCQSAPDAKGSFVVATTNTHVDANNQYDYTKTDLVVKKIIPPTKLLDSSTVDAALTVRPLADGQVESISSAKSTLTFQYNDGDEIIAQDPTSGCSAVAATGSLTYTEANGEKVTVDVTCKSLYSCNNNQ